MAKRLAICTLAADARAGWPLLPEERLGRGAVPSQSLAHNALLTGHRHGGMRRFGLVSYARAPVCQDCIARFDVRCGSRWRRRVRCPAAICKNSLSGARSCSARKP